MCKVRDDECEDRITHILLCNILSIDIHFNSGYITHITTVHTMGSHTVRTLKALDLCKLA
jgi:hypothetical protein